MANTVKCFGKIDNLPMVFHPTLLSPTFEPSSNRLGHSCIRALVGSSRVSFLALIYKFNLGYNFNFYIKIPVVVHYSANLLGPSLIWHSDCR